ncbi:MAG: hypothetical protein Q8900_14075 [Bacillota bacterium]|nr:hypothetical protein [Bacillota bacterium]
MSTKRINVMISEEMDNKLNEYGLRYGISKSAIVGFVVGQWMDGVEKTNNAMFGATGKEGFFADMMKTIIAGEKNDKI